MRLALLFLSALALIPAAHAQQRRPVGTAAELAGCWKKIVFSGEARKLIPEADIGDARHQVLCFDPDGSTFRMVGSAEPLAFAMPKDYAALAQQPKGMSYQLPQPGLVVIGQNDAKPAQEWSAAFFPSDVDFFGVKVPKDTLVMGLTDPTQPSKIVHWRYLTKIAPTRH